MRAVVLFVAGLAASGCQDPTVTVRVELPAGARDYGALYQTMAVTVLTPGEDAAGAPAITCDDLALDTPDARALARVPVTGVILGAGDGVTAPISDVPRRGAKLWLAEGTDRDGTLIVAGCAVQGDIDGDSTVTIVTEPAAQLTAAAHSPDQPVPDTLEVTVDDGLTTGLDPAVALPGRALHWDVYGPGGAHLAGDDVADGDGRATLALAAPADFGPVSIQLRARWARDQPVEVPAFTGLVTEDHLIRDDCPSYSEGPLLVQTGDWHGFRLASSAPGIAALARVAAHTHLYVAVWKGATGVTRCGADLGGVAAFAALRPDPVHGAARLVTVSATQWVAVNVTLDAGGAIAFGAPALAAWTNPGGSAPVALVTLRDCGTNDGANDLLLAQLADDTLVAFGAAGDLVTGDPFVAQLQANLAGLVVDGSPVPRLTTAGCIAQGDGLPPLRAALFEAPHFGNATTRPRFLTVDLGADHFEATAIASFGAIAFTPERLAEPYVVGGAFEPDGAKVVRWRVSDSADGLALREEQRDDSLGPPASLQLDRLDGDDALDTVWGLLDAIPGGLDESRLQVSLGCGAGELPLVGISPPLESGAAAVFVAPDVDAQRADLAIGGARGAVFVDTSPP